MREIIFRGKSKENGKWVYGTPVSTLELCDEYKHPNRIVMFPESSLVIASGPTEDWNARGIFMFHDDLPVEVIPETVGQFTGLYDRNGKRVFEGDILESKGRLKRRSVVKYGEFNCGHCFSVFGFVGIDGVGEKPAIQNDAVIGNIHDNPELVKEETK